MIGGVAARRIAESASRGSSMSAGGAIEAHRGIGVA